MQVRLWTLLSVLLPALVAAPVAPAAAPNCPNVLYIAVDDLRPALGCYGNPIVRTPNIDRLAARGVRFDRAYCQFPLCNPSRTSLLTGRYPVTTGVMDNLKYFRDTMPGAMTLPQAFRAAGYVAARTGKIFHGGIDDLPSWDEGGEPGAQRQPRNAAQAGDYRKESDRWAAVDGDGEDVEDHRSATRAIALLEKHRSPPLRAGNRPFFIAAGFAKPHSPLIAPRRYFDRYDAAKILLPPNFAPDLSLPEGAPAGALSPNSDLFIGRRASEQEAREMIRAYYACVSFIDAEVGRVLAALGRLGLARNTVVVFFGDHGYHLGEMGKWSKHNSLYEVAARVPLIIAGPGAARGGVCGRTVGLIDLYPTLLALCGLPAASGLEGRSLAPLLRDPGAAWDRPAITYARGRLGLGQSVRTEQFRYTSWGEGRNGTELYDHARDPDERRNVAGDAEYQAVVERMKRLLRPDPIPSSAMPSAAR